MIGLPDDTWGEVVAAALVASDGQEIDLDDIRSWCQGVMSPYKIPRLWHVADSLPRNAMGKVTKPAVRERFPSSG